MITDLAPAERRGEAVSYWSVAVYGGLAFGPALGDVLRGHDRYLLTFVVSSVLALLAAGSGLFTVDVHREHEVAAGAPLLHRAALRPGTRAVPRTHAVVGVHAVDAAVRATTTSTSSAGAIFLLYGILILFVRIVGARSPDRLGRPQRRCDRARVARARGSRIIAVWPTLAGLVVGTIVFACGMSLMYPALLLLALVRRQRLRAGVGRRHVLVVLRSLVRALVRSSPA